MASTNGSLSGARAYVDALISFLSSNGWTQKWSASVAGNVGNDVVMVGSGSSAGDAVCVGLNCVATSDGSGYLMCIYGMGGINATATTISGHLNVSPYPVCIYLSDMQMNYWFTANTRRFIAVAQLSSVFECAYAGWFLPYCLPAQYPNPMFIGGSTGFLGTTPRSYQNISDDHTSFCWPNDSITLGNGYNTSQAYVLDTASGWRACVGRTTQGTKPKATMTPNYWSTALSQFSPVRGDSNSANTPYSQGIGYLTALVKMVPAYAGTVPLKSVSVAGGTDTIETYGILDGVNRCFGGVSATDTLTSAGQTHLVVPNVFRTDTNSLMTVVLD